MHFEDILNLTIQSLIPAEKIGLIEPEKETISGQLINCNWTEHEITFRMDTIGIGHDRLIRLLKRVAKFQDPYFDITLECKEVKL